METKKLAACCDSKTSRLAPDLSRHNLVSLKSKDWSKWVCVNDGRLNFYEDNESFDGFVFSEENAGPPCIREN